MLAVRIPSGRLIVFAICFVSIASGCVSYPQLGKSESFMITSIQAHKGARASAHLELRGGDVIDLAFAIKGHECNALTEMVINLSVRYEDKAIDISVGPNEMTWITRGRECLPIGYVRLNDDNLGRPLKIRANRDSSKVSFDFEVVHGGGLTSNIDIWIIFNDQVPIDRILMAQ